jgi:hypothetical protein
MTRQKFTFLLAGFIAGNITAAGGRVSLWVLTIGGGPIFFVALLAAMVLTGSWPHRPSSVWRYLAAAFISTMAYVLAFLMYWWLGGYMQILLGDARSSTDLGEFRLDIWIGLIAAGMVAAIGIELVAYVLTSRWSNAALIQLMGAGILAIVLTFFAIRVVRFANSPPALFYYWSFFGALFSVGEALFCGIVGAQLSSNSHRLSVPAT